MRVRRNDLQVRVRQLRQLWQVTIAFTTHTVPGITTWSSTTARVTMPSEPRGLPQQHSTS